MREREEKEVKRSGRRRESRKRMNFFWESERGGSWERALGKKEGIELVFRQCLKMAMAV